MLVSISRVKEEAGRHAAEAGAEQIRQALRQKREAHILVATGTSQFDMLANLVRQPGIDWKQVTAFHLDEYVGIPPGHAASFRRYLKERLVDALPVPLRTMHYINGNTEPESECKRLGDLIRAVVIDVAFVGIGENGHLAFNDPPADLETEKPYLVVQLDEACRRQQLNEGWFSALQEVPQEAISMSVRQILKSRVIVCTVPDRRKASAVKATVEGGVTPSVPASALQGHQACHVFLDADAAALLATGQPAQGA